MELELGMAAKDSPKVFGSGRELFRQGDKGGELFFITEGQVELSVKDPKTGNHAVVAKVGPRNVLGTMSFLEGEPRSATAKALTEVKCIIVTHMQRERLLNDVPVWFRVLVKELSGNLRQINQEYAMLRAAFDHLEKNYEVLKRQNKQ